MSWGYCNTPQSSLAGPPPGVGACPPPRPGTWGPVAVPAERGPERMTEDPKAADQGVGDVEVTAWTGIVAPAGTPAPVVARINQEVNEALKLADVREKFLTAGIEPLGGDAQVLANFMRNDDQRYGAIARALNIKAD